MNSAAPAFPVTDAELLGSLLAETAIAIDVKDPGGRYLRVSPSCATLLGLRRPEEAVGRTAADFLSAAGAHSAQVDEQAVMRTGRAILDVERRELHANGNVTWMSVSRQPLLDSTGTIVGTIGMARDITRRKLADEALRATNERLKRVIATQRELAGSAHDLHAVMQVVADRAVELTGADGAAIQLVDGEELLTRAASGADLGPPQQRRVADGVESHALRSGRPLLLKEVAKDPRVPGSRHGAAHSLVCAPFFHAGVPAGTVEVFIGAPDRVFDEHDRNTVSLLAAVLSTALSQAAESTARRTEVETLARFEATFQGAPNGIAMVTADGAIAACNPAFHAFVGYTDAELAGLTLGGDLLQHSDAEHDALFAALISGDATATASSASSAAATARLRGATLRSRPCATRPAARPSRSRWCRTSARASRPRRRATVWSSSCASPRSSSPSASWRPASRTRSTRRSSTSATASTFSPTPSAT